MFCTAGPGKNDFLTAIAPAGEDVWNFVTLLQTRPWFLVSYTFRSGRSQVDENALLGRLNDLVDLLNGDDRNILVQAVLLVTPGEINGSDTWKMEPLKSVWQGEDQSTGAPVVIYQVAGGQKYHSPEIADPDHFSELTCVVNL